MSRRPRILCRAGAAAAALLLTACSARLPTYPWTGPDAALATMAERAGSITSLRSPARLVLVGADGSSVTLDAAFLAEPPDRLRLRAWKLGHAVFDLTVTGGEIWLKADRSHGADAQSTSPANLTPESIARAWRISLGDPFEGSVPQVAGADEGVVTLRRPLPDAEGVALLAHIDRATRTPRRYEFIGPGGEIRATLDLSRYRLIDGIALPTRLAARGPEGSFTISLSDPELNIELPASAFRPPAGAVRQP